MLSWSPLSAFSTDIWVDGRRAPGRLWQSSRVGQDRDGGHGKRTDWTEQGERSRARRGGRKFLGWFLAVAIVVTAAVLVKVHVAEPFSISSASMEPSLRPDDRVVVDKLRYRLGDPRRGDVIVFGKPAKVQRVIAVGGDEIEARGGIVYVNDRALDESYLREGTVTTDIGRQRIPDDRYWVMGDRREESEDSRLFGPISESVILGRAVARIWPASDLGWIRVD